MASVNGAGNEVETRRERCWGLCGLRQDVIGVLQSRTSEGTSNFVLILSEKFYVPDDAGLFTLRFTCNLVPVQLLAFPS